MLDLNRQIFTHWYRIFLDRMSLLVPPYQKVASRDLQLNDIVLFMLQDSNVPKMEIWKLGRVVQLISARTVLLQYSHAGEGYKQIRRSVRQITLILGIEEYSTPAPAEAAGLGQSATCDRYDLRSRQATDKCDK
jgi:hypothetical protein